MNTTLFAGPAERQALLRIDNTAGTDWCLGAADCKPWQDSKQGRERYAELKARFDAQAKE